MSRELVSDSVYSTTHRLDQTTRIHGPISSVWHELGRPQVHGYDCLGAAFLETTKFVSISDEKVARVFEAPGSFVKELEVLDVAHFTDAQVCIAFLFINREYSHTIK